MQILARMVTMSCLLATPLSALAQGSLTPSGFPGPTMKTLQQVEPRTPLAGGIFNSSGPSISSPGHYYLTGDVTVTNESAGGINIFSSNVVVDLNGYTVRSTRKFPTNTRGVQTGAGYANITIRNGRIEGFNTAVLSFCNNTIVENITVVNTSSRGINIAGNYTPTFVTVIRNNTILNTDLALGGFTNNGANGILTQGASGLIEGNTVLGVAGVAGFDGSGISVELASHMLVVANRVSDADYGIFINAVGRYRDNVTMATAITNYFGGTNLGNNQ